LRDKGTGLRQRTRTQPAVIPGCRQRQTCVKKKKKKKKGKKKKKKKKKKCVLS
jgi:hypothetical protein